MPSLRGSGKIIEFPFSVKKLAYHCNLSFPLSLRQLIANPDCPPRPSVTISASPDEINVIHGVTTSTLSWTSTDATSASLDVAYADTGLHDISGPVPTSGAHIVRALEIVGPGPIICEIAVTGPGGTSTATRVISVVGW
jgi:hypothetical protein